MTRSWPAILIAILWCLISCNEQVAAGLSGENVALIVNGSSPDSLTIANHYISLRDIPMSNVIVLDDVASGLTVSLDDFRDQILRPVFETINARGLAPQIHLIAYSAGFPTSVNISPHTKRLTDPNQQKYQTPTASINSLTYFYRWVLSDSPDYLGWGANFYARGPFARHFANPFGGEKREQFQAAMQAVETEEYQTAAERFEALADEYPTLHPLRILAAKNWLRSDEQDKALEQVRAAVKHGWTNRRYLTETEPLAVLFGPDVSEDFPARQRLLQTLQDVPRVMQGPLGFSSSVGWTMSGHPVARNEGAMPYMLSCVLAVIHENGSTLEASVANLQRAVAADRTYPEATFGFSKTSDVRSTTRFARVADALAWLLYREQSVEIFPTPLPKKSHRYVGLMLGAANLPVQDRQWTLAPGAIAENLTSLGANFRTTSQTKLTELLDAGAAISSGAVAEPYSITFKFPNAMLYPYYYEGVTAIEAFYLTLPSPYQMLIVGDPLCQPYARPANDLIQIQGNTPDSEATPPTIGITWQPLPDSPTSFPAKAIELYLNGKLSNRTQPIRNINVKLPAELKGGIDFRVILLGNHPTEPRIAFGEEIVLGDKLNLPEITRLEKDDTDQLTVLVQCTGADRLEVVHGGRVIAKLETDSGRVELSEEQIGHGPVRLQAIAHRGKRTQPGRRVEIQW